MVWMRPKEKDARSNNGRLFVFDREGRSCDRRLSSDLHRVLRQTRAERIGVEILEPIVLRRKKVSSGGKRLLLFLDLTLTFAPSRFLLRRAFSLLAGYFLGFLG